MRHHDEVEERVYGHDGQINALFRRTRETRDQLDELHVLIQQGMVGGDQRFEQFRQEINTRFDQLDKTLESLRPQAKVGHVDIRQSADTRASAAGLGG